MPDPTSLPLPRQGERHICGAETTVFGVQCQLDHGHNSAHRHEDDGGGVTTWEPRYVGDLRRQADERLDALVQAVELLRTLPGEWDDDDREVFKWLQGLIASA